MAAVDLLLAGEARRARQDVDAERDDLADALDVPPRGPFDGDGAQHPLEGDQPVPHAAGDARCEPGGATEQRLVLADHAKQDGDVANGRVVGLVLTAADLEGLGEAVRAEVQAKFGVELEWEIKRIGRRVR